MKFRSLRELPKPIPPPCYIKPGILPVGGIITLMGEPGVGKSRMLQQILFEIASGRRVLGLFPATEAKVLYMEYEKRSEIARGRFYEDAWWQYYPKAIDNIHYYDEKVLRLDRREDVNLIRQAAIDMDAQVIAIDSFATAIMDDVKIDVVRESIGNWRDMIKESKMCAIFIQHIVKKGDEFDRRSGEFKKAPLKMDDMKGSKFLSYEVDAMFGLTKGEAGRRNFSVLKHSHSPIQYSEQADMSFEADLGSCVPFKNNGQEILRIIDSAGGTTDLATIESMLKIGSRHTTLGIITRLSQLGFVEVLQSQGHSRTIVKAKYY